MLFRSTGTYTGAFNTGYTGTFLGTYTGLYNQGYIGSFSSAYTGIYAGTYTGIYTGLTAINTTSSTTYTLWVRTA